MAVRRWFGRAWRYAVGVLACVAACWCGSVAAAAAVAGERRYELVSPADKNGADVVADSTRTRAAPDGDAVGFISLVGFGDVQGTGVAVDYMSQRRSDGWVTHALTPRVRPQNLQDVLTNSDPRYEGEFSRDFTKAVYVAPYLESVGGDHVQEVFNLYLREDLRTPGAGAFRLLTAASVPVTLLEGEKPWLAGTSADFTHVVFATKYNLVPEASGSDMKLYEWHDGNLRLVGILPSEEGGGVASYADAGNGVLSTDTSSAVSDDGERIIFKSGPDETQTQLYMREHGSTTIRINRSEKAVPDPTPSPAQFWAASADGTKVFFTSAEQLTEDDRNTTVDLYRYDHVAPAGSRLTRLSVDGEPADGTDATVDVVAGVSDDGTYVYFTALGQLEAGKPLPPPATPALYVWHDGVVRYIGFLHPTLDANVAATTRFRRLSRVTPSGRHLVFVSSATRGLLDYDNGSTCGFTGDLPCAEVYVYDAAADGGRGRLMCASCRPDGATATADAALEAAFGRGGAAGTTRVNRAISTHGRYVFFTTAERLVADDRNGVRDVYQFDTESQELTLISSGRDAADSYFLDASEDGRDVFFATRERLVGWDRDNAYDLYDARVGGGFPEPPEVPAECEGEACRPGGGRLEIAPTASELYDGRGNVAAVERRAPARLTVARLSRKQLARLARAGVVVLRMRASAAGRVTVVLRARIGRRERVIGRATERVAAGRLTRVTVRIGTRQQRALSQRGTVVVRVQARHSRGNRTVVQSYVVRGTNAR